MQEVINEKHIKKKTWFLFCNILLLVFLVGIVSAFEFDNVQDYDKNEREYTITNALGIPFFGKDIAKIKLTSDLNQLVPRGYQKVAEFEIENYDDYINVFNDMEFFNLKDNNKGLTRNFDYKYKTTIQVPNYENVCNDFLSVNGTLHQNCNLVQKGLKDKVEWIEINKTIGLIKGNITIGIFTNVEKGDKVEWITTLFGERLIEWAIWEESWNVGIVAAFNLDELSGSANNSVTTGAVVNGTITEAIQGLAGKINNSYYFDGSNDVVTIGDVYGVGQENWSVSLWVNTSDINQGGAFFELGSSVTGATIGVGGTTMDNTGNTLIGLYNGLGWIDTNVNIGLGWVNIVLVINQAGDAGFWINGSNVYNDTQFPGNMNAPTPETKFGGSAGGAARYFKGEEDLVYIWNRSLLPTEIIGIFDAQKDGFLNGSYTDVFTPTIALNAPINAFNTTNQSIVFNGTVTKRTLGILNVTLFIDSIANETNSSGINNTDYLFTKIISDGDHNWTFEACDTDNACDTATTRNFTIDITNPLINITYPLGTINFKDGTTNETFNWTATDTNLDTCFFDYNSVNTTVTCVDNTTTFTLTSQRNLTFWANDTSGNLVSNFTSWNYLVLENSQTFNSSSFETATENFKINVTTNGSVPVNGNLIYNGITYSSATITNTVGNNYDITRTIQIPTGIGTNNWSFNFTLVSSEVSTTTQNQIINATNFTYCGAAPVDIPYLNFSFKDEADDSILNASNDLTDIDFWLGDGTVTKNYIASTSTDNFNYTFCSNPSDRTINLDMVFKYSKTGYPLRTFAFDDQALTNTTTEQTLYLLATADGIYSSISIIETSGNTISGVKVIIERQFSGVWTTVGLDNTGSDGVVTFWVNPNFQHRITATKTGYVANQVTITPSQSLYTLTLQKTTGAAVYTSQLEGIKWVVNPASGTISPGSRSFNATVTSSESNLENCKFELVNVSNISQTFSSISAFTNSSYCFLDITYLATVNNNLFGRLSLDTTNTTGFVIVNADWKWILIDITDVKAWRSITSFFSDLKTIGEFGEGNEGEFSRIVVFFIFMTLGLGVLIYFTGIELSSPGITITVIWVLVLFASVGGFLTFESGSSNVNDRIEQYGFFFILTLYVLNYFLTIIRRANE